MKNTGQGETSTVEQSKVDEPVSVVSRNDKNKLKNMKAGDKLEIRVADTLVYDEPSGDYFPPMFESGSMINKRMLDKGEIVTYKGVSKESNNIVTNTTIIYLSVTLSDGTDAYVRLADVKLTTTKTSENSEKVVNNNVKIATTVTSRAGEEKKNIGQYGEQYVVGIAAGRNNDTDVGNVNDDKGLIEEELTIKVAEEVEKLLQDYSNIKVVQTGSTSSNPSNVKPENRAEKNRNLNPNLCIQIYFNNGEQAGVQTIYKEGDAISQQLAEILSNNLSSVMGLTNLNSGTDTEKCKNSQGESASLNIIENAAVTGFPSVVAMGGNLNKEPDASVIASDGVSKYAQAIVKSIDEYFKADHSGRTATEQEETKYKDSVESRIINMKYVSPEKLQEYVDNADFDNAIKSFTLDDNGNLVIVTWSTNESGELKLKTNNSMNLKTALSKYMMPYEYLLYFYIDSDDENFVSDLADEVMNSEIVMAIQDNVTTTDTIDITEQRIDAQKDKYDTDWHQTAYKRTVTESVSTSVNLTYVSTWCVKAYQENSYSEAVLNLGNNEEKIVNIAGKVTESKNKSQTDDYKTNELMLRGEDHYFVEKDGKQELVTEEYYYNILEHLNTSTHMISNSYEKGEYKTEGRENVFVNLYIKYKMVSKVRTADFLFQIIENNERTANMLDLTKYLIYKATNQPWGVLEFDYSTFDLSKFNNTGSAMGGLDTFREYLRAWEGNEGYNEDGTKYKVGNDGAGHPTVGYGIDIYNSGFLDRFLAAGYDVSMGAYIDVEFVDALEMEEIQNALALVEEKTSGLNLTQYQKYAMVSRIYNCGSSGAFTERNGKTFVEAYNSYWNQETDDEYKVTANDGMYNHALYQNYMKDPMTSNGQYLSGLENRRKSEWLLFKTGYYDRIDKWCSNTAGGIVVEKAIECHAYLRENGFRYAQAGINVPITGKGGTVDCSSYVSWVLYEAGFTEFEGYQKTSGVFTSNPWGWEEVSVSEAQPGDIVTYSGHVEIIAADAGDRFRVYNCGDDKTIQTAGTDEYPETCVSANKNTVLKIIRPPQK